MLGMLGVNISKLDLMFLTHMPTTKELARMKLDQNLVAQIY
jgi:hypothetical protein